MTTVLAGSLVFNTIHAVNHVVDLDIGGLDSDRWVLGGLSVLIAIALVVRWRQRQGAGAVTTRDSRPSSL